MHTIPSASIHIALCVGVYAIRQADIRVSEQLLVL